ncbi:MAG: endonuclease/exonuclease/phosphatase family protein [Woeseiaceae bacterium]|nr:endonuclease/exonuclease/phosphatase family protein [Woeseiaceae bacterium]
MSNSNTHNGRTARRCAWLLALLAATAGGTPRDAVPLRVMTFNIEWGGTHVSFDNVIVAIQRAGADIVGIQEAEGNLDRIAAELGWYYNARNYVVSRFPLAEPPAAAGRHVLVEVVPDHVVAVVNVHLPSDPYGPDAVRDGATRQEVLALERATRLPEIEHYLPTLASLIDNDTPVFLTGDFNTPAHTDWIADAVGTRKFLRYTVDWPVTRAVAAAGLRDAWRTVYPDPVLHPGLTWWAGRPPLALYAPGENDAQDRIDFIWYGGPADVNAATLVGEQDGPGVTTAVMPWPSDHRAVVASFSAVPAPAPALVTTVQRVHRPGDDIGIVHYLGDHHTADIVVRSTDAGGRVVAERTVDASGRRRIAAPGHLRRANTKPPLHPGSTNHRIPPASGYSRPAPPRQSRLPATPLLSASLSPSSGRMDRAIATTTSPSIRQGHLRPMTPASPGPTSRPCRRAGWNLIRPVRHRAGRFRPAPTSFA